MAFVAAGCASSSAAQTGRTEPARARAFVGTFDRILVAGLLADNVSDRGHVLDINEETARALRMTLRSRASLEVIETPALVLRQADQTRARADEEVLGDVPFWRRLGEEYREPLILTGSVAFKPVGPQFEERTVGRHTVRLWRPGFSLEMRLVFISGRTGQMLDSVSLGPVTAHAPDGRTSALALYFELMDRLRPFLLAALDAQPSPGYRSSQRHPHLRPGVTVPGPVAKYQIER